MKEAASSSLSPGETGSPRLRLPSLTTSSSSLSSTFSDISFSSFSPSGSKTQAFFASPFSTRPHSPEPVSRHQIPPVTNRPANPFQPSDHRNDAQSRSCNEPTPRPASLVPALFFTEADADPPERNAVPSIAFPIKKSSRQELNPEFGIPPPPPLSSSSSASSATSDSSASPSQTFITGQNTDTTLKLLLPLGQGSFSSVWLAEDFSPVPLMLKAKRRLRDLRKPSPHGHSRFFRTPNVDLHDEDHSTHLVTSDALEGITRNDSLKRLRARVRGTKPKWGNIRLQDGTYLVDERDGEMGVVTTDLRDSSEAEDSTDIHRREPGLTVSLARVGSLSGRVTNVVSDEQRPLSRGLRESTGRVVAVKLTPRDSNDQREAEKERVAFVREVEVLRHISHPNIAPLLSHLSTPTHYVLVFPYLPGGDLLGLVNSDVMWHKLGEDVLRRIWCEVCKAVSWMHGVGLVHRDIKLENILLATSAFGALAPQSPRPTLEDLPAPPTPLIRLSDFGLSRFVELLPNGESELLATRCGSEAYAAPELVTAGGRPRLTSTVTEGDSSRPRSAGFYDARETDAWACGVVLYALVARNLPFGDGLDGDKLAEERASNSRGYSDKAERRRWLMRIAKGEYTWPEMTTSESTPVDLAGAGLASSRGAKRIVGKLLVRDPGKRARIADLWSDPWMKDMGIDKDLHCTTTPTNAGQDFVDEIGSLETQQETNFSRRVVDEQKRQLEEAELHELEHQEEQHGAWLVDEHAIHNIARQEVA